MIKKIFLLLMISTVTGSLFAQNTNTNSKDTTLSAREIKRNERKEKIDKLIKLEEEGAMVFSKQTAWGVKLNTDGWGFIYEHGKYKTITKTNLWWLQFEERKSPKEEKVSTGQDFGGGFLLIGNPFIFGKQNNFYSLKAGLGQQRLIGGKGNKNGVAVSAIYGAGISLGYLKPYYIAVRDTASGGIIDIKYSDATANTFLDPTAITGGAGFGKGFSEGSFVPGAQARLALRFDYGRFKELLSAIEVGVNAEYYTKEMPIMVDNPAKKFFFNGYIAFEFGKRK
jgi:hypothetical protein